MSEKSKYIPAVELEEVEADSLVWRVALPDYVSAEEIGVNAQRLGTLARLGGFESLRIASYDGEIAKSTPGINSVEPDGSATASMSSAIAKVETQMSSVFGPENDAYNQYDEYNWTRGQVLLNTSELEEQVAAKGAVRDAERWSAELNGALTQGIRSAAKKNLVDRPNLVSKIYGTLALGSVTAVESYVWANSSVVGELAFNYLAYQLVINPFFGGREHGLTGEQSLKQRRWSLVSGTPYDRLLAVNGLSRMSPLVKHLKPEK